MGSSGFQSSVFAKRCLVVLAAWLCPKLDYMLIPSIPQVYQAVVLTDLSGSMTAANQNPIYGLFTMIENAIQNINNGWKNKNILE